MNELNEEQTNKITTWACTCASFNLSQLTDRVMTLRASLDDSEEMARKLIRQWKARGKIKFLRGYWKWQF